MILDMTINLENMRKSEAAILELLKNPWVDNGMFNNLMDKLERVRTKITELEEKENDAN